MSESKEANDRTDKNNHTSNINCFFASGELAKLTELVKFNRMYLTCIITVLFHEERKWLRKITRCVMFPVARSASTQANEAAQGSLSNAMFGNR